MASEINYASIDETFPLAGKDNDSQGFRDNFGYIKNSLQAAKSEIETLQLNTAKTSEDNNFNFNQISEAAFINCGEVINDGNTVSTTTVVDYASGSLQIFEISGSLTMTLSNFPEDGIAARLRIHLTSAGSVSRTVTFNVNAGTIKKDSSTNNPITVASATNPVVVDFWTYNGGTTIFMKSLGTFI